MTYNLFLDDERDPPSDGRIWIVARSFWEFKEAIRIMCFLPEYISFDHDLGEDGTGYDCAKWLCDNILNDDIPGEFPDWYVHSQNPVGAENINCYMENARRFLCSQF